MSKKTALLKKLIKEFLALGRNYSWRYASYNLLWWICFYVRTGLSWRISKWALEKKTAWLDRYVEEDVNIYLNDNHCHPFDDKTEKQVDRYNIWVFWGQGEEAMPKLVKACYKQLTKHNDNVCLITSDNVADYIDLPDVIFEKVNDGRLSWAHFSDIVRTSLLAKYGGLWLDATVWVAGKLPLDKIKEMPFWSANSKSHHSSHDVCFWTSGEWNWSTWCLSANCNNYPLLSFVSQMLIKRAMQDVIFLDYVLMDYFFHYACKQNKTIRHDVENMTINNPNRNKLAALMNEEYSEEKYKALLSTDFVFKLSYRTNWKDKTNNKPTFYQLLINNKL